MVAAGLVVVVVPLTRDDAPAPIAVPPEPRVRLPSARPSPSDGGLRVVEQAFAQRDQRTEKTATSFAGRSTRDVRVLPTTVPGLTIVTWTATNNAVQPVRAAGVVVYRDAAGELLGAEADDVAGTADLMPAPGDSTGSVTYRTWFPPGTDPANLQVTPRPGYLSHD